MTESVGYISYHSSDKKAMTSSTKTEKYLVGYIGSKEVFDDFRTLPFTCKQSGSRSKMKFFRGKILTRQNISRNI